MLTNLHEIPPELVKAAARDLRAAHYGTDFKAVDQRWYHILTGAKTATLFLAPKMHLDAIDKITTLLSNYQEANKALLDQNAQLMKDNRELQAITNSVHKKMSELILKIETLTVNPRPSPSPKSSPIISTQYIIPQPLPQEIKFRWKDGWVKLEYIYSPPRLTAGIHDDDKPILRYMSDVLKKLPCEVAHSINMKDISMACFECEKIKMRNESHFLALVKSTNK